MWNIRIGDYTILRESSGIVDKTAVDLFEHILYLPFLCMFTSSLYKLIRKFIAGYKKGINIDIGLVVFPDRHVPPQWRRLLLFRAPSPASQYLLTTPSHIDLLYPHWLSRQAWHTNIKKDNIKSHWAMDF